VYGKFGQGFKLKNLVEKNRSLAHLTPAPAYIAYTLQKSAHAQYAVSASFFNRLSGGMVGSSVECQTPWFAYHNLRSELRAAPQRCAGAWGGGLTRACAVESNFGIWIGAVEERGS